MTKRVVGRRWFFAEGASGRMTEGRRQEVCCRFGWFTQKPGGWGPGCKRLGRAQNQDARLSLMDCPVNHSGNLQERVSGPSCHSSRLCLSRRMTSVNNPTPSPSNYCIHRSGQSAFEICQAFCPTPAIGSLPAQCLLPCVSSSPPKNLEASQRPLHLGSSPATHGMLQIDYTPEAPLPQLRGEYIVKNDLDPFDAKCLHGRQKPQNPFLSEGCGQGPQSS